MIAMTYKRNKKGFTLIELIVTVILVAILASYAVYHYNNVMDEGKLNAAKGKLAALGGATQRFILEHGSPVLDNQIEITSSNISGACNNSDITGVFTCGYAEKSLSSAEGFKLWFKENPCSSQAGITVYMAPVDVNSSFPSCIYFDPSEDKIVEVDE